jgi:uncharacterized protein (TIGR02646 family)
MRHVPKNLTHLGYIPINNKARPNNTADAKSAWDNFGSKQSVINALLAEQYLLCCYTEIDATEEGWGYHIEHIENKSQNPARTFDPTNLGACALSDQDLKKPEIKEHKFGGHAVNKTQGVDMQLFIHCQLPNCSQFFAYLSDGTVVPALGLSEQDKARAQYTIDQLNLNSHVLQLLRQKWQKELDDAYAESTKDSASLQRLIQIYISPVNNKLQRFFTMSQQFFTSNSALA